MTNNEILAGLIGRTIQKIEGLTRESEEAVFFMDDGGKVTFYHGQDCCEIVRIEDVCGDAEDLIGSPITQAEEAISEDPTPVDPFSNVKCEIDCEDSQTWTFYKFATVKGSVTVRWLGQSNGYYSEDVNISVQRAD